MTIKNYINNMSKQTQKSAASPKLENALFDNLPNNTFPEPIWLEGSGKVENKRLIVSIKLTNELKKHVKNDLISFSILEKKEPDLYGKTHSVLLNQSQWPQNQPVNRNFLTTAIVEGRVTSFTLTIEQLKSLAYPFTPVATKIPGQYMKVEIVNNGMQSAVFRFYKERCREIDVFLKMDKLVNVAQSVPESAQTPKAKAEVAIDAFFNDL
jgi:hypothetical protein